MVPRAPMVPIQLTAGPFYLEEARRYGLTKDHLRGASWRRLGGGFYAWRGIADDPTVTLAAVMRRLPDAAVFSGRTAAWLHGLDVPPCDPIEVTRPPATRTSRLAGMSVRRSAVATSEMSTCHGLPATSMIRTIADLGRRLPLFEAVATLDMALHRGLVDAADLGAWVADHRRYPGIVRLRRVIDLAEPATESVMETRLRLLLVLAGLPRPQAQVSVHDENGWFLGRPDLYYPHQRLALEYDGASHRESLVADSRRQNRLVDAGYRPLRFTAPDVMSAPDSVVRLVGRALAAGTTRPAAATSPVAQGGIGTPSIPSSIHSRGRAAVARDPEA